jgi:hypothetical protein
MKKYDLLSVSNVVRNSVKNIICELTCLLGMRTTKMPPKHLPVSNVPKGLLETIIWNGTWNPFTKNAKHLNAQFAHISLRENTTFLSIFLLFTPKSNRMDAINANRAFYRGIIWEHTL